MIKFNFNKERIILDEKFFMLKEFVDIWKYDRSKKKDKANKLLFFIFLLCDISDSNPLTLLPIEKREEEAKFKAFHDREKTFTEKELALLEPAITLYIDLNMSVEERLLSVFDSKAEQLKTLLEDVTPETVENKDNGVVTFASNSKLITDALNKLSMIRKNRASVVASIKKEAISEKIRGQLALSPLVKGLIKIDA